MRKILIHCLVNGFTPEQSHLVSDLNANDMTNYLLSTDKNRDKTTFRRRKLTELTRKLDMDLRPQKAALHGQKTDRQFISTRQAGFSHPETRRMKDGHRLIPP
jgi:hypothetical protein